MPKILIIKLFLTAFPFLYSLHGWLKSTDPLTRRCTVVHPPPSVSISQNTSITLLTDSLILYTPEWLNPDLLYSAQSLRQSSLQIFSKGCFGGEGFAARSSLLEASGRAETSTGAFSMEVTALSKMSVFDVVVP